MAKNNFQFSIFNFQFWCFVQKEFYHIFRDRRTVMVMILMPIIQVILFGFAITTEVKNVKIAIYDPSRDVATQHITEKIGAGEFFIIDRYLNSPAEIDRTFREGEVSVIILFSDNFGERLLHTGDAGIQVLLDASEPNQASSAGMYINSIIADYQQELMREASIPFQIRPEIRMLYNPSMKSGYNFVPGVMGMILMLICAMMTSIAIVREKEMGTMEVLLASPVKPIYVVLSKMSPYFVISWFNLITILLLSVYVLGVPVSGNLFWLNVLSLLFIVVALGLGLFISTLVDTQVAAMLASGMGMIMPVMLLSGFVFPTESMPPVLQWLSTVVPARWYIAAVRRIMIEGAPVQAVWKEFAILAGMAAVIITVSLKNFKSRLE
ncbi:MAG: ABC transporter permease [Prevotellaceae bacterium]|nr:ABC transporter permease [Prevotellaceae bacterium]